MCILSSLYFFVSTSLYSSEYVQCACFDQSRRGYLGRRTGCHGVRSSCISRCKVQNRGLNQLPISNSEDKRNHPGFRQGDLGKGEIWGQSQDVSTILKFISVAHADLHGLSNVRKPPSQKLSRVTLAALNKAHSFLELDNDKDMST